MRSGQLVCAVLTVLVLLVTGCGGGEGGNSGGGGAGANGGGGADGNGGGGDVNGSDVDGNGGDGGGSEFAVDTELDLGQAFAEEPAFDGALGPVEVSVRTDRGGGSNAQIPITFRLVNAKQADLEDLSITIRFSVLPGTDPEDPLVPAPGDPALELSPRTSVGTCTTEDTTSSGTTIACTLGTLANDADAMIAVTSPQSFRFSIGMELMTRGA